MSDQLKVLKERIDGFVAQAKQQRDDKDRKFLMENISQELAKNLMPLMKTLADNTRLNKADFVELTTYLKQELANIQIPVPEIVMPEIPAPVVNIAPPIVNIPEVKWPKGNMPIEGWVNLMGVSLEKPLPVQLRNPDGSPVNLFENINILGGGGGHGIVKIGGIPESAWGSVLTADGRLKTEAAGSGGGLTNTELRATAVPVSQVSGANWSVSVTDITATNLDIRDLDNATDSVRVYQLSGAVWSVNAALDSTNVTTLYNADNRLRVSVETGGSGLTDSELRASAVPVSQLSGASWSVEATQAGTWNIATVTAVTDVTNSVRVLSLPETLQTQLANITTSVQTLDNAIAGSEMQVDIVSGFLDSAVVTGAVLHDAVDTGSAPVKIGGTAIQTNPTAVADGDIVRAVRDDIGRTITRPIHVRDLINTAYVSVTNGTETTLLAAVVGSYLDCISLMCSNNSDAAVSVDVRAVTAGSIVHTIRIPANATAGWVPSVPWPQDATGNNWTVDGPDETGRTLTFSALFSREI